VLVIALAFGITLACRGFDAISAPPDDGGPLPANDAEAAPDVDSTADAGDLRDVNATRGVEVAPDGALFFDSAENGGCRDWLPTNGFVDPVEGDAGSWYCRFCVSPGLPYGSTSRSFPIPVASGSNIYEGDVFVSGDTPDSGLQVYSQLVYDGGSARSTISPVPEVFSQLQVKTLPLPSETGATMWINATSPGCFRFDHAYVLQYPP
jgi:hypothetical protein